MVKDINSGGGDSKPLRLASCLGKLYFCAANGVTGSELWISDGTTSGTQMLKDIYVGADSSHPAGFIELGTKVIFSAEDGAPGREVWITDGTLAGTQLLKDITPGAASSYISGMGATENGLYLSVRDNRTSASSA